MNMLLNEGSGWKEKRTANGITYVFPNDNTKDKEKFFEIPDTVLRTVDDTAFKQYMAKRDCVHSFVYNRHYGSEYAEITNVIHKINLACKEGNYSGNERQQLLDELVQARLKFLSTSSFYSPQHFNMKMLINGKPTIVENGVLRISNHTASTEEWCNNQTFGISIVLDNSSQGKQKTDPNKNYYYLEYTLDDNSLPTVAEFEQMLFKKFKKENEGITKEEIDKCLNQEGTVNSNDNEYFKSDKYKEKKNDKKTESEMMPTSISINEIPSNAAIEQMKDGKTVKDFQTFELNGIRMAFDGIDTVHRIKKRGGLDNGNVIHVDFRIPLSVIPDNAQTQEFNGKDGFQVFRYRNMTYAFNMDVTQGDNYVAFKVSPDGNDIYTDKPIICEKKMNSKKVIKLTESQYGYVISNLSECLDTNVLTEAIKSKQLQQYFKQHGGVKRLYSTEEVGDVPDKRVYQDGLGDVTDDQILSIEHCDSQQEAYNLLWQHKRNGDDRQAYFALYKAKDGSVALVALNRQNTPTDTYGVGSSEVVKKVADRRANNGGWNRKNRSSHYADDSDTYYYDSLANDFGIHTNHDYQGKLSDIKFKGGDSEMEQRHKQWREGAPQRMKDYLDKQYQGERTKRGYYKRMGLKQN